jgi:hypothetical protein
VLSWAAEEAERATGPLLLAHAAGHLPPQMTYSERHVARAAHRRRGEQLLDEAARHVHLLAPTVTVTTLVRLLAPDALWPAIAGGARTSTRTSPAWSRVDRGSTARVVAAVHDAFEDGHVAQFAMLYAAGHALDLSVVEGRDASLRAMEQAGSTSLLLLPRPQPDPAASGPTWPMVLDVVRRAESPVVLVSGHMEQVDDAADRPVDGTGRLS